jgi:hypothetical protein
MKKLKKNKIYRIKKTNPVAKAIGKREFHGRVVHPKKIYDRKRLERIDVKDPE